MQQTISSNASYLKLACKSCHIMNLNRGMVPPDMIEVGSCLDGYYGALCSSCMPGFARSGKYGCSPCPEPARNISRITGLLLLVVFAVAFLVRSTLAGATQKNTHSVYTKILMNHLQLLAICASFRF